MQWYAQERPWENKGHLQWAFRNWVAGEIWTEPRERHSEQRYVAEQRNGVEIMKVFYGEWKLSRSVIKSIWKHRIQNCKLRLKCERLWMQSWGAWTFSVSNPKIIKISGQEWNNEYDILEISSWLLTCIINGVQKVRQTVRFQGMKNNPIFISSIITMFVWNSSCLSIE